MLSREPSCTQAEHPETLQGLIGLPSQQHEDLFPSYKCQLGQDGALIQGLPVQGSNHEATWGKQLECRLWKNKVFQQ